MQASKTTEAAATVKKLNLQTALLQSWQQDGVAESAFDRDGDPWSPASREKRMGEASRKTLLADSVGVRVVCRAEERAYAEQTAEETKCAPQKGFAPDRRSV